MPKLIARTGIRPDYLHNLYYTKGDSVYAYNKATRSKRALVSRLFERKPGFAYFLKTASNGELVLYEENLENMRKKSRSARSSNARRRNAKKAKR